MLTSLLSLYIAQSLDHNLSSGEMPQSADVGTAIVQTANSNIERVIETIEIPTKNPGYISPVIDATGIISIDRTTGKILYEKNSHERMPIASITKLMTILIILEENSLDEVVTVSANAAGIAGSQMYLLTGEEITVENLIYGAIIHSANDAALALAEHNAGSKEAFVAKMNKRALELGLVNTHFATPTGLDHPQNYSSPFDVSKLANYIYHNPFIQKAAKTKNLTVTSTSGKLVHKLENTNDLLDSYLNIKGLKTGSTEAAGLCLVSVAENSKKNEIITVVLNSPDRFRETKILTDWSYRAFTWQ